MMCTICEYRGGGFLFRFSLSIMKQTFKDPNLLSDDEVFLDSAASTVTSSMTSGMTSGLTSPQPPAAVVVRAQHVAVAQSVRGEEIGVWGVVGSQIWRIAENLGVQVEEVEVNELKLDICNWEPGREWGFRC